MTFAIDGIFMSHPQSGGYKTYTANLVHGLRRIDKTSDYLLLTDREIVWEPQPNWRVTVQSRRGRLGFVWREQVTLPRLVAREGCALLHCPGATGPLVSSLPVVVTIYDTIEFSQPLPPMREGARWGIRVYSRYVQKRLAQKSVAIVTISDYSKTQIVQRFGVSPEHVTAIHLAPSEIFHPLPPNIVLERTANLKCGQGYILAIASAASRKNIPALLRACALLDKTFRHDHALVLVCTHQSVRSTLLRLADSLGLEDNLVFLEQVSDDDLVSLYNGAGVFVFPSLEEGFGLPPLEAMACGAPVVASNTSSLPEILGDAALFVSPTNVQQISEAITQILTDSALAAQLQDKGLQHSRRFSWENTARQTLALYKRVAEGK